MFEDDDEFDTFLDAVFDGENGLDLQGDDFDEDQGFPGQ